MAHTQMLSRFDPAHAELVSSWARSAHEVLAWCSRTEAPVPPEVIVDWAGQPHVRAYTLRDPTGAVVAYGELWIDDDEREVELARLIVDPDQRNRGIGRTLVTELVEQARLSYPDIFLRVLPDNEVALRCYAAAGFVRVSAAEEDEWNRSQPTRYAWLRRQPG